MEVAAWLRGLGLERYEPAFREHDVDAAILHRLTGDDLAAIGIASVGHRRRLLDAIAALSRAGPEGNGTAPEGSSAAPAPARAAAERRQLTVMFVDLVGSTVLTSRLDPEEMRDVIHAYQGAVAGEIVRFEGHVAKFMGDGVLAYFGWPRGHEDEGERAVRAGLAITAAVARLTTPEGGALSARIGIATGLVVVGDLIGEGSAREETVVGETPNLAARLQALAEPGNVVIAPLTRQLLGNLFELEDIGAQALKGFAEPIQLWRVLREGKAESRFEALHGALLTPLVGREKEIALLLERFQQAKRNEGQVVLLSGEPGIGKSRIIEALRERLRQEPYMLLNHFCTPFHANSALHPVIGMIERTARFERDESPAGRLDKLEALLSLAFGEPGAAAPLLAALLSIPSTGRYPPIDLAPQAQKRRTLELLIEMLAGLAARQPVVAVYEDLHWADPTTLDLLDRIVERVEQLPVLAIATFRPEFSAPWLDQAHVTALPLGRLVRGQGAVMIKAVAGGKSLPPDLLDQIVAKTDGVPLFVEELTRTLLESGQLQETSDRYLLAGSRPSLSIPTTLQDSLAARLDHLGDAKETAQLGAALGREFSYALLAAISPLGDAALRQALARIVNTGLLFQRGKPPDAGYMFKHVLVQDTAYAGLLKSRRQQVHSRIADVLAERYSDRVAAQPELLAHHHTEAGEIDPAIDHWFKAGERAAERSANAEAVAHLRRSLELLSTLPDTEERARRELAPQIALGVALIAASGYGSAETVAAYERARALCERLGDVDRLLPALYGQCANYIVAPDCRVARSLAEELLRLAESRGAEGPALVARRLIGFSHYVLGDPVASRENLEQIPRLFVEERDRMLAYQYGQDNLAAALSLLSVILWLLGYPDRSASVGGEAIARATSLGHANTVGYARYFAGCLRHVLCRDWRGAQEHANLAVTFTEQQKLPLWHAWAKILQIRAFAETAPSEAAVTQMREILAAADVTGTRNNRTLYLALMTEIHCRLGQVPAGLRAIEEALDFQDKTGERCWEAEIYRVKGELLLSPAQGDPGRAARCFEQAIDIARAQSAKSLELRAATSLARLLRDRNDPKAARDLLAPVYGWFTEGFGTPDLIDAKVLLEELT